MGKNKFELKINDQKFDNVVEYAEAQMQKDRAMKAVTGVKERLELIEGNKTIIDSLELANTALKKQLQRFKKGNTSEKELSEGIKNFLTRYEMKDWGEMLIKLEEKLK